MDYQAQLFVAGVDNVRTRCILRLLSKLPVRHYHASIEFVFKNHRQSLSADFIGTSLTVALNAVPECALMRVGMNTVSYDKNQIRKLKAESDLLFLLERFVRSHHHTLR